MNPKTFPHPESEAPLGAGTGVAARPHPSRTIFLHAPTQAPRSAGAGVADRQHSSRSFFLTLPHRHWQTGGCCPQGGTRPAGEMFR